MNDLHILLVEDNEGDILLTREAFEERKIVSKFSVARNGKEALEFIFKEGKFSDVQTPDLILMDINMPLKNGLEVLREIKMQPKTREIPVIMLTTSSSKKDITAAYQAHANSYIAKPLEMKEFLNAVLQIENYWLQLIKLPSNRN
jgi:CheY-like chemotaxis protein